MDLRRFSCGFEPSLRPSRQPSLPRAFSPSYFCQLSPCLECCKFSICKINYCLAYHETYCCVQLFTTPPRSGGPACCHLNWLPLRNCVYASWYRSEFCVLFFRYRPFKVGIPLGTKNSESYKFFFSPPDAASNSIKILLRVTYFLPRLTPSSAPTKADPQGNYYIFSSVNPEHWLSSAFDTDSLSRKILLSCEIFISTSVDAAARWTVGLERSCKQQHNTRFPGGRDIIILFYEWVENVLQTRRVYRNKIVRMLTVVVKSTQSIFLIAS